MTENTKNPMDSKELSNEQLDKVAGGYWDYEEEQKFKAKWQSLKDSGASDLLPYEAWIANELAEYDAWAIQDRQIWLAAGSPTDRSYSKHGPRR